MPYSGTGQDRVEVAVLLPQLKQLVIEGVAVDGQGLRVVACTQAVPVACDDCGGLSARVHSRYRRRLEDLPVAGRPVVIDLGVRRMVCTTPGCPVGTFAEQVPGLTRRYQRRTCGLGGVLEAIALALAGRAGARMAAALGIAIGRSTLLRLIRALPDPVVPAVRVLGVDDFARRRGHVYGTVLVDMDTHDVIDVLDDRLAATLTAWLGDHPGIEVICRDRAGAYAEAATTAAPDALQVADRWHLWHNLGEHLTDTVRRHRPQAPPEPPPPPPAAFAPPRPPAPTKDIGIYLPYLHTRWEQGCHNAAQLHREITATGYNATLRALSKHLQPLRAALPAKQPAPKRPKLRQMTRWIMTHPDHLTSQAQAALATLRAASPELDATTTLIGEFAKLLTGHSPQTLPTWLNKVHASDLPDLKSFATGLERDHQAVHAALTTPYNSGPVEGTVNKIKNIKRQMYGRANFDLLRKRVLLT